MHDDVEQMLTRELRQVADHVEVPPMPDLPSDHRPRFAWTPVLAAAAVVLIALITAVGLSPDRGSTPQPAPQPTDSVTDDATDSAPEEVPAGPPKVPYLLGRVVHVGDKSFPGYDYVDGTLQAWVAMKPPFVWAWSNGGKPQQLEAALEQPPAVSPNGEYVAHLSTEGELNGFQTAPAGEGMGLPASVPVRDDDGVGTRVGAVTNDGWVIASGRGVGVLWRPFVDGKTVDLTKTAPGQLVWQATYAGLVVVDGTDGARDPGSGRVYLADVTADGELVPLADLPNFGMADVSGEWVAWVPAEQIVGDVMAYDEIQVRRLDGDAQGVLSPPRGWRFDNTAFTFEDDQFLVARVNNGQEQRMARCSPALQECVLLDTP
jgi:hypothetical protein